MATKKKTSAADFRMAEEKSKKKPLRADSKGRTGMGATKQKSTYESRTGIRTNKSLNNAQNIARSIAIGGFATTAGKAVVKEVGKKVTKSRTKSLQRQMSKHNSNLARTKMDPNARQAEFEMAWEKMIKQQIKRK